MKRMKGNLFSGYSDTRRVILCATTNGVITQRGLVMGGGSALQMAKLWPDTPMAFVNEIQKVSHLEPDPENPDSPLTYEYHLVVLRSDRVMLGAFQTKRHYADMSSLRLIKRSLNVAKQVAEWHPEWTLAIPYPGIGLGGLDINDVGKLIEEAQLPDNIHIWTF